MGRVEDIFDYSRLPFVIAEVALSHDGSLGLAHAFIDAVARTGVDAIKYQTHIAEAESSALETFRVQFSKADATRYDYWRRTEFTEAQWVGLKEHAEEKGLVFLSSPFSIEAVNLLDRIGVAAWKVPSGETGSRRMLERMARTGRPMLVSTGMSAYGEVDEIVKRLDALCAKRYAVFQSTTQYPTPPEVVGMNVLGEYMRRYDCPIGLSDHSGTIFPSLIACWRGARLIEVHVTLSRDMSGPDLSSSLTVDQLTLLVQGIRFVHTMRSNPVIKDVIAAEKGELRRLYGKSAIATRTLKVGEIVNEQDITFRKPGHGLSERTFDAYLGRKLKQPVAKGKFFEEEDFE